MEISKTDLEHELEITGLSDELNETKAIGHCIHCNNFTLMLTRKIYNYKDDRVILGEIIGNEDELEKEPHQELIWLIQECFVCKKLSLKEKILHFDFGDSTTCWIQDKILYPVDTVSSNSIPSPIEKAYDAALKVKTNPNSFALLAGHTLESMCRYEQAQGKNLHEKLKYLAQKGRIPDTLAEMAQQVRLLRNLAVHNAEDNVTEKDVPIILEFLGAILEYLYVAPAKIKAVQTRLTKNDEDDFGYM
jgi:hypothetical protein